MFITGVMGYVAIAALNAKNKSCENEKEIVKIWNDKANSYEIILIRKDIDHIKETVNRIEKKLK